MTRARGRGDERSFPRVEPLTVALDGDGAGGHGRAQAIAPHTSGIDEFGWREVTGIAPIACAFIKLTPEVSGLSEGKR